MLSNVDKIYGEYPFIERHFPRVKTKIAQVKRWNENFYKTSPISYWGERLVSTLILLNEQGELVARVGKSRIPFWTRDENAGQALARLGEREKEVRYALYMPGGDHLILYKR